MEYLQRQINLIGEEGLQKLKESEVSVFGLGGVGSFAVESLARAGIGKINIVDNDIIDITNINRQLYALHSTIGKKKIDISHQRLLDINPNSIIDKYDLFIDSHDQIREIIKNSDYVLDCIDTVDSKIKIIEVSKELGIEVISSMGTGNKLDPTKLKINDVYKTDNCPLAKKIRKDLRKKNIEDVKVICSDEGSKKIDNSKKEISTISFLPPIAGLLMASECIRDILEIS